MKKEIKLGDLAQDQITKFKGIVVCISIWLNGCKRITIQPQEMKDGRPTESGTFDEEQVVVVKSGVIPGPESQHGGPSITPVQRKDPK